MRVGYHSAVQKDVNRILRRYDNDQYRSAVHDGERDLHGMNY